MLPEGRARRDEFFRNINQADGPTVTISKRLRRQIRWWIGILSSRRHSKSRIWSKLSNPRSVLMRTDASGVTGFGICVRNLHIFGMWRHELGQAIVNDMLFKETLPIVIATVLLAPACVNHVFAACCDNAGAVFRINAGSSRNPLVQRLLRLLAMQIQKHGVTPLVDWNDREQPDAKHADLLSKTFSTEQWSTLTTDSTTSRSWLIDLIIHDLNTGQAIAAVFRIPAMD